MKKVQFKNKKKNWKVLKAIRRGISCIHCIYEFRMRVDSLKMRNINTDAQRVILMEDRIFIFSHGFQKLLFNTYIRQE